MSELDIVDQTVGNLVKVYGQRSDAAIMPEPHRIVLLVNSSIDIISNGGFHYLLEGTFLGDEEFLLTRHAFKVIGAKTALKAFTRAFAVFPNSIPPPRIEERLEMYESRYDKMAFLTDKQSPDAIFFSTSDEAYRLLQEYIQDNLKTFESLK
jgi:hypothetical protein